MKAVALVGMPGAGKSEVAHIFAQNGYQIVRFGDFTDEEVRKRGLQLDEKSERMVREELRQVHGMAAYAILNLPRISRALKSSDVIIDGLYSWEEYKFLLDKLEGGLRTVAVWAPPGLRYQRLANRKVRPLTLQQARARDFAEIENVNKGGPIAMADYIIKNDATLDALADQTASILRELQ